MFFYNSKDSRLSRPRPSSTSILEEDQSLVSSYLLESIYRRRQISLYLDYRLIEQCSSLDNSCDLYLRRTSTTSNQVSRVLESRKQSEEYRLEIQSYIVQVNLHCVYCSLLISIRDIELNNHLTSSCSLYNNLDSLAKDIKKLIQSKEVVLVEDSYCFRYLFPKVICTYLSNSNSCFDTKFMFRILACFYNFKEALGLDTRLSL